MSEFNQGDRLTSKITNNKYIIKNVLNHGVLVRHNYTSNIKFISNAAATTFYEVKQYSLQDILKEL